MKLILLISDSDLTIPGIVLVSVGILILFIWSSINSSQEREKNFDLIEKTLKPKLSVNDTQLKEELIKLSKWINNCNKCNHNQFSIHQSSNTKLTYRCNYCNSKKTLKYENTFYTIEPIPTISKLFNEIISVFNEHDLIRTIINGYGGYEPIKDYVDGLNHNYFVINHYKKHTKWEPNIGYLTFQSEGSELDRVSNEIQRKKIGKLSPNRKQLDKKIINEWNYKSINTGKKGLLIKNWAKKSGLKCIDGTKCGGVKFESLENREITFGHIIPQSWATEYPHMFETIHHPDNLYLTCKSCNSSLNSDFPDKELKKKISGKEGTIGDWLRTHITDINKS